MRFPISFLIANLPYIAVIAFLALIFVVFREDSFRPALRMRLLEVGYKFRNWRATLRSLPQKLMLLAGIGLVASLSLTVIRANGQVEHLGVVSNRVVTDTGVQFIANAFLNTTELELMNYHASGTGTTAEAASQTALVTEVATRVAGTQSSPSNGAYRTVATIPYTGTLAIAEHAILSASSAGTMLDRSQFTAVNVVNGDSIQFTYTITFASGG